MAVTNYCECDNTHENNNTVCQYCHERREMAVMKARILEKGIDEIVKHLDKIQEKGASDGFLLGFVVTSLAVLKIKALSVDLPKE